MTIKNIDAKTLKKWLDNNEAVLIDVRQPAEHNAEKIDGAKLAPLDKICLDNIKNDIENCNLNNKKLVLHCQGGVRSLKACEKLKKESENLEIYNLTGGINAFKQENSVISSKKSFISLDRQVQLTIGFFTLIGSALAFFVNIKFLIIPAFFGAGLAFAGLTGFCGLAMFLAKMPWNK